MEINKLIFKTFYKEAKNLEYPNQFLRKTKLEDPHYLISRVTVKRHSRQHQISKRIDTDLRNEESRNRPTHTLLTGFPQRCHGNSMEKVYSCQQTVLSRGHAKGESTDLQLYVPPFPILRVCCQHSILRP